MIQQRLVWNDEQNVYILLLLTHPRAISSSPYIREKKFNKMCASLFYTTLFEKVWIYEFEVL